MKWRKGDFIIMAVVILVAVGILVFPFGHQPATHVKIFKDGSLAYTYPLNTPFEKEVSGCTVKLSDGEVRIVSSTCPDKVCVSTGAISKSGEIIVCVPNRVSVKVTGEEEFDALVN